MNERYGKILLSASAKVNDGDVIDPRDGLLYCGRCGAPKQVRIPAAYGTERIVTCLCRCQEAEWMGEDPHAG